MNIEERFKVLAEKWHKETYTLSSIKRMIKHPSYQAIIAMGEEEDGRHKSEVITLILKELEERPNFWFYSLRQLTGYNPVEHDIQGSFNKMVKVWLSWGKSNGYIK